jgi:K(+)-stimulated pyrophosphate-energized sodium pump
MYDSIITFTGAAVALCSVLCILQITRKISVVGEVDQLKFSFALSLQNTYLVAVLFFGAALAGGYYLDFLRHGLANHALLAVNGGGFIAFLMATSATERLHRHMQVRGSLLQKNSMSRIFRHFLYAGALLGLLASLLSVVYSYLVNRQQNSLTELFLLPAYGGALLLYWLRFNVALVARSSEYAFELLGKQEAILPLLGTKNPLWTLRQYFAATNRFLFYHLEFFLLCSVVLLVATKIENQTGLHLGGLSSVSITIFSLGIVAAIPAFFIMRVRDKTSSETFLWNIRIGYIAAISIHAILTYLILVIVAHIHIKYFWIVFLGTTTALLLNVYSAIYVAESHKTARGLIAAAASSVSTVIHRGIASGMRGSAIPALIIAIMMSLVYLLGVIDEKGEDRYNYGLFAIALALTSMVSLFSVGQATAIIMPLASTAIGRLRMLSGKAEKPALLEKFRNLRSVAVPSYVLHGQIMFSALAILIFVVYAEILSDVPAPSLFKHLTQTGMLLLGGITSYFLSARVGELVLNLGPLLVRETSRQFREISGLTSGEAEPNLEGLWQIANQYLKRKTWPLVAGTMLLPGIVCLLGGAYGLAGYLIGFGFFGFLNGNSWMSTGAAWSSARHAAEADTQIVRHTAQLEALIQADIVGDSMHEAAAPILSLALLVTVIGALLFTPATLELHELIKHFARHLF